MNTANYTAYSPLPHQTQSWTNQQTNGMAYTPTHNGYGIGGHGGFANGLPAPAPINQYSNGSVEGMTRMAPEAYGYNPGMGSTPLRQDRARGVTSNHSQAQAVSNGHFVPSPKMSNERMGSIGQWTGPGAKATESVEKLVVSEPINLSHRQLFTRPNSGINFDNYESIPVNVSGQSVQPPVDSFADAGFLEVIQDNIDKSGYTKPTPVQKHSIPTLMRSVDLMSCAQTGSGKTAAFLLPIIHHIVAQGQDATKPATVNQSTGRRTYYPGALVLSPTRELAIQIHKEAMKFSFRSPLQTAILYGGKENYREQVNMLRSGCHILIATPGRLIDILEQGHVSLSACRFLVLDEADRMLDMGFEPQIRRIVGQGMPPKANRVTAMFSATFPKQIQELAQDFLRSDYVFLSVGRVGSTSENIDQKVFWVDDMDKRRQLIDFIEKEEGLTLVFVETKRGANELAYFLTRQSIMAVAIHGDLKQLERERNLEMFRSGANPVLVATAVAARGLDIPNVRQVVNFDLPNDIDEYVHRIGRTGRCGHVGTAVSFFTDKNRGIGRDLQSILTEANQEVPEWLITVAAEGKPAGRQQNRRFGGTDHRRGRGGNTNSFTQTFHHNNGSSGFNAHQSQPNGFGQPHYQQNGGGYGGSGGGGGRGGRGFSHQGGFPMRGGYQAPGGASYPARGGSFGANSGGFGGHMGGGPRFIMNGMGGGPMGVPPPGMAPPHFAPHQDFGNWQMPQCN